MDFSSDISRSDVAQISFSKYLNKKKPDVGTQVVAIASEGCVRCHSYWRQPADYEILQGQLDIATLFTRTVLT